MKTFKYYVSEERRKNANRGTYAGLHFCDDSVNALSRFVTFYGIPNIVPPEKLHVTLLYSRKFLPDFVAQGKLARPIPVLPKEFTIWETNGENEPKSRCLILKLESAELVRRHLNLMKEHEATFDYPEYQPHVTLSYDIGDLDISHLDISPLPSILYLCEEYQEELNLNWASTV